MGARMVASDRIFRLRLLLSLSCRYPHDVDGVADDIGGAFLALWSLGHGVSIA